MKITITKGKKKGYSTINVKAGKGEDLRGIVEALAGKKFEDPKPEDRK